MDDVIEDIEHVIDLWNEREERCFEKCSKRKIMSLSNIANCLMDTKTLEKMKKINPSKFHFLQKMMRPPKKTLEKLINSKISDGKQGETKKKAANQKTSDFYKTKRGQLMKNKYNDRANLKKDIINKVLNMECSSDLAEMEKESILNLLRRMK